MANGPANSSLSKAPSVTRLTRFAFLPQDGHLTRRAVFDSVFVSVVMSTVFL